MHYSDRLKRWAVIRLLPNCQRDTIALATLNPTQAATAKFCDNCSLTQM